MDTIQMQTAFEALKTETAKSKTRCDEVTAAFTIAMTRIDSMVKAISDANPKKEIRETVEELTRFVSTCKTVGLGDMPDMLKPPVKGVAPAALPPLVPATDPSAVHVTGDGTVVYGEKPDGAISLEGETSDKSNVTGEPPADPGEPMVQPPNPEHT